MKSLYRKYRPLSLSDVVGQEQVTVPLAKSLKAGRITHAYLFVGPRGCGKTSVARILAHEVNGFQYELEDDYVDIIEIDGASNRGIDNIRELREKVLIAPTSGKYKVYIIDEVHMLTKEAFNALLKTLEEPPQHAIFVMATTDAHKVPVTITSRAQTFTFNLVDKATMVNYLRQIAEREKIKITDDALEMIAKRGGGSFRDSLSLLDQLSTLSDEMITKEILIAAMGLPEDEKIEELLNIYNEGNISAISAKLREILSTGVKPETLVEEIISRIIGEPRIEFLPLLAKLPDVKAPYAEARLLVAFTSHVARTQPISQEPHSFATTQPSKKPLPRSINNGYGGSNSINSNNSDNSPIPESSTKQDTHIDTSPDHPVTLDFNWDEYTTRVERLSEAVYMQLIRAKHEMVGGVLHIYPMKKVVKSILSSDKNKPILIEAAGGVKITIHEANETPNEIEKDEMLDKISAIMGGEVINDGGGDPFQ